MAKHIQHIKYNKKTHYTILCNTLYNINNFLEKLKAETILELINKNNYKNLHLANLDKKNLSNNNKDTKISNIKYITLINKSFISKYITST